MTHHPVSNQVGRPCLQAVRRYQRRILRALRCKGLLAQRPKLSGAPSAAALAPGGGDAKAAGAAA